MAAAGAAAQGEKQFELSLVGGKLEGAAQTLRVPRGAQVQIKWSSDRRMVLHLHGYDIERKAEAGAPAIMAFRADVAGRFPVSEHRHDGRHHRAILYLEVHP